jgi:manganese efflux pump family protein
MISILLLSLALAADAFAASIACAANQYVPNTTHASFSKKHLQSALSIALVFGFFQGIMPLIGYQIGTIASRFLAHIDHWIAFILLAATGLHMIHESLGKEGCKPTSAHPDFTMVSWKKKIALGIATSIDALIAGTILPILELPMILSALTIGLVTCLLSMTGYFMGYVSGAFLKSKAQVFGGGLLICMGIYALLSHL